MGITALWQLYSEGKFEDVLAQADALLGAGTFGDADVVQLHSIRAWCFYRRQQYDKALEAVTFAQDHPRARACHVFILAYAPNRQNDALLMELLSKGVSDLDSANALTIRARAADSIFTAQQVLSIVSPVIEAAMDTGRGENIGLAHLFHNCARYFLDKTRGHLDLIFARGLMESSVIYYGSASNWHHRAAAQFWLSTICERLGDFNAALSAAEESVRLWELQCQLSTNAAFKERHAKAKERVETLAKRV